MGPSGGRSPSGGELIGLGVFLAAAVVVPLLLGIALDDALHSGPVFLFVGLGLGVAAAAAGFYMRLRRYL